jgi:NAD(P)-dependent dehydrogenase (short-subunit alcohol dehydrogenase family)
MNVHSNNNIITMKTIFITGASSGLGKAAAKLFAEKGWKVLATMREPEKETELNGIANITLLALDVAEQSEIQHVVAEVISNGGAEVVFNNAGYALAGPLEGVTDEQLVKQIDTNLLGPIRVTQAFLPYFRERRSGIFINTTSLAALIPDPFMSVYRASKAGLEGWSAAMTFELNKFGISMKTIIPGFMKSGFTGAAQIAGSAPYQELLDKVVATFNSPEVAAGASTPEEIAAVVFEAATDGKSQLRYLAGNEAKTRFEQLQKMGEEEMIRASDHFFFG